MVFTNVVYKGNIQDWRDLAVDAQVHNHEFDVNLFKSTEGLLYWWLGSHAQNERTYRIYFDIKYGESNKWKIIGAVFLANYRIVSIDPFLFNPLIANHNVPQRIELSFYGPGQWFRYNCKIDIELNTLKKLYKLLSINFSAFWGPVFQDKKDLNEVIWKTSEIFSSDHSGNSLSVEIPCPACFGRGFFKGWAIPKEAYERGATGYDLYSCNTICSTVACSKCGGVGVQYEKWYLQENPHLNLYKGHKEPFFLGSGVVQTERLPSFGNF